MSRVSPGTMTIAILAILFGLGGAYAARVYLNQPQVQVQAPPPDRSLVPVASVDLPAGRQVRMGDIALMRAVDLKEMPPNTISMSGDVMGRTIKEPIKAGTPFTTTNLYLEGMGPSITERLRPGFRAMSILVDDPAAASGQIQSGMVVDVLFRAKPRTGSKGYEDIEEVTLRLFQGVDVLAVQAAPATRDQTAAKTLVTLGCSAEQAARLRAVEGRGDLSLAVWSEGTPVVLETESDRVTLERILGIQAKSKNDQFTTEIYRAGSRSISTFERGQKVENFDLVQRTAAIDQSNNSPKGPDKTLPASLDPVGNPASRNVPVRNP